MDNLLSGLTDARPFLGCAKMAAAAAANGVDNGVVCGGGEHGSTRRVNSICLRSVVGDDSTSSFC